MVLNIYLNFGDTSWRWWNLGKVESSKKIVVFRHGSFSFKDLVEQKP